MGLAGFEMHVLLVPPPTERVWVWVRWVGLLLYCWGWERGKPLATTTTTTTTTITTAAVKLALPHCSGAVRSV
jgi:hypothetical protein